MVSRPSMLSRCGLLVLIVGLVVQFGAEVKMSWATDGQAIDRQTVPTRTPTPEPAPPTEPPPPPTDTPVPPPPTHTAVPPTHTPAPLATLVVSTPVILAMLEVDVTTNVYSGPGFDFSVVGSLERGDTAPIMGRTTDSSWWQIGFLEGRGWVSDEDVTASPAAYDVPIISVSSTAKDNPEPENLPLAGGGFWLSPTGVTLLIFGALLLVKGVRSHWRRSRK
jgi:hypothetical protein